MNGGFQPCFQPAYQQVQVVTGGWIFKRVKHYVDVDEEDDSPPPKKKTRKAVLRVVKRAAKVAVEERRVEDAAPLVRELKREHIRYSKNLEDIYWKILRAEIQRAKNENDDEEIALLIL